MCFAPHAHWCVRACTKLHELVLVRIISETQCHMERNRVAQCMDSGSTNNSKGDAREQVQTFFQLQSRKDVSARLFFSDFFDALDNELQ